MGVYAQKKAFILKRSGNGEVFRHTNEKND